MNSRRRQYKKKVDYRELLNEDLFQKLEFKSRIVKLNRKKMKKILKRKILNIEEDFHLDLVINLNEKVS